MSVGTKLKKARKSLGLTIEDIQDKSKIKKNYIKAMENDNFEKLPGDVYTKVYIRGYAKIVGLDPREILDEYESDKNNSRNEEVEENNNKKVKNNKNEKNKKNKEKLTKSDKILRSIIGIILILILVLLSYNMFFRSDPNQNDTAISDQNSEVVEQESSNNNNTDSNNNIEEEDNQTEVEETESENVIVNENENNSVNENISEEDSIDLENEEVNNNQQENNSETQPIIEDNTKEFKIIATDKSWLQVTIDNDLKFQGFINEDETMTHNGEDTVTLKIGNGVAVQVEINGELLGPFGKRGEVIIKQFDLN